MARIIDMLAVFIIVIAFNSVVVAFFHPFLSSIFILTVLLIDFSAEDKAASRQSPCFVKSPRTSFNRRAIKGNILHKMLRRRFEISKILKKIKKSTM